MSDETPDSVDDGELSPEAREQFRQEAETFEMPENVVLEPLPGMGTPGIIGSVGQPSRSSLSSESTGLRTLEDLYDKFRDVGRGDWKIRIERLSPVNFDGRPVAGYLGEYNKPLSTTEFKEIFGGGTYTVTALKPSAEGGRTAYRSVGNVKIRIAGSPTMEGVTDTEDRNMSRQDNFFSQAYPGFLPQVELEKVKQQGEERKALWAEQRRMKEEIDRERRAAMEAQVTAPMNVVDRVQQYHKESSVFWQQEVDRLRAEARSRDEELSRTREELVKARSDAAEAVRTVETAAIRELKERHQEERQRQADEKNEAVNRLNEQHMRELASIRDRHAEERRNYESIQSIEREKMRDEMARIREESRQRIDDIERAKEAEISRIREDYQSRNEDSKRFADSEVKRLQEMFDAQITMIRESERMQASMAKETAEGRIDLIQTELARIREEAERKREEAEQLRTKLFKPPVEAMREARELAGEFGGMVDASQVQANKDETTADKLFGLAKGVVENAPQVIERIAQGRQQQLEHQQNMAMHQARLQQMAVERQRQALPPAQRPAQLARPATPASVGGRTVPGFSGRSGYTTPLGAGDAEESSGSAVPLGAGSIDAPEGVDVPMSAQPGPMPEPQQHAVPEQGMTNIPQEAIGEFMQNLEQAIRTRAIDPAGFAEAFIERVGVDITRQLLSTYTPSDIVEAVRQSPGGDSAAIVTRDGQKYMNALWQHAGQLVGVVPGVTQPSPHSVGQTIETQAEQLDDIEEPDEDGESEDEE